MTQYKITNAAGTYFFIKADSARDARWQASAIYGLKGNEWIFRAEAIITDDGRDPWAQIDEALPNDRVSSYERRGRQIAARILAD